MENTWHFPPLQEIRVRFRRHFLAIQQIYPASRFQTKVISPDAQDEIAWIEADPLAERKKLLIISVGQHGIEGYFGFEVLDQFIREFLHMIDPRDTGLLIISPINPWGMRNLRKVDADSVDLNRNFINPQAWAALPKGNLYPAISRLVTPEKPVANLAMEELKLFARLIYYLLKLGRTAIMRGALQGQYFQPGQIYYGGSQPQAPARLLMELFQQHCPQYEKVLHIDMHTGYGPRDRMSVVCSPFDPRTSTEIGAWLGYPDVVKTSPGEFYEIHGDMVDYQYQHVFSQMSGKDCFAATFEFGTYGDSALAGVRSLFTMVIENQNYWHGSVDADTAAEVKHRFVELYYPSDPAWKKRALENARRAWKGVLTAFR